MSMLNQLYLSKLLKQYEIERIEMFENDFSAYCVSLNKRVRIYLILCDHYSVFCDINTILDRISLLERNLKTGNSYLCVMPLDNPTKELCTHCNGKSFVHFMFFDTRTNDLVYDKGIYYLGSKQVKRLIDIYQDCFNDLRQSKV